MTKLGILIQKTKKKKKLKKKKKKTLMKIEHKLQLKPSLFSLYSK
jgi:hypothetical protein